MPSRSVMGVVRGAGRVTAATVFGACGKCRVGGVESANCRRRDRRVNETRGSLTPDRSADIVPTAAPMPRPRAVFAVRKMSAVFSACIYLGGGTCQRKASTHEVQEGFGLVRRHSRGGHHRLWLG